MLRFFTRIFNAGIVEREFGGGDRELRVTIEPLQAMRREKFCRIPVANLAAAMRIEPVGVERGNAIDTALLRKNAIPEVINAFANARDRTDASNDRASSAHAVTLL